MLGQRITRAKQIGEEKPKISRAAYSKLGLITTIGFIEGGN
jgi:hypothetical protein